MRKTLLKSLLVGAAMVAGATNVWADDYTTYYAEDFQSYTAADAATGWSSSVNGRHDPIIGEDNGNKYMVCNPANTYNNGAAVTCTATNGNVEAGTDFTMLFDLRLGATNDKANNFIVKDASGMDMFLIQGAKESTTWTVNGTSVVLDGTGYKNNSVVTDRPWYRFKFTVSGSVTYLTITAVADDSEILARTVVTTLSNGGGLGNMIYNSGRNLGKFAIDNILVRSVVDDDTPSAAITTYTVKFVDGLGNTIKDSEVITSVEGATVTATDQQAKDFTDNEDVKWIYESGNVEIVLDADATKNIITLVFHKAATYTYNVVSNLGTVILNGSGKENDEIYYGFPEFILKGTNLYSTSQGTEGFYRNKIILTENTNQTIEYTASVENVAFFTEAEDIEGATVETGNNANVRCSYAKGAQFTEDVTLTTLPAGSYRIFGQVWGGAGTTFTVKAGENAVWSLTTTGSLVSGAATFVLEEDATLTIPAVGSSSRILDLIYIQQTAVPITPAYELTTYASKYDLDFTGVEGLTAYIAPEGIAEGKIVLEQVNQVKAGQGMVLVGTANQTYNVPVTVGVAAPATNYLVGVTEDKDMTNVKAYILATDGKFHPVNGGTLKAGKAYLNIAPTAANSISVVFGDEATGIETVKSETVLNGDIFNLRGQRVVAPSKGLYIMQGKKVIVK